MQIYNTLTRRTETFAPHDGRTVRLYVCGITPYDTTHMGHAMTYLTFDVLNRLCQYHGWRVTYVQNVTDVDDDIIRKAREVGDAWDRLGDRYIRQFQEDLNALNVLPPAVYPRASDEVPAILEIVTSLIEQGNAYEREGNVYFRVASAPDYGQLCGHDRATMRALSAERGANPDDPLKEDPLDFLLWQAAQPDEPTWESPWGAGRPGWHIECSAMAMRYLGPRLDIHGGGGDLIYPHHESEIAQSESYSRATPFARFWMHVAMVGYGGEKMSKSLGNLVLVRDAVRQYSPDALRLYLHSHHYRQPFEYEDDGPAAFEPLVIQLGEAVWREPGRGQPLDLDPLAARFIDALDDDLNIPLAIDILREMTDQITAAGERGDQIQAAQGALRGAASLLGLTATR
jgi:L-cysteine:1D-myo-inositol 2-amino-2-deoxy-alpha-D-glucopyranoside ligase